MADYKQMYHVLCRACDAALTALEQSKTQEASSLLQSALFRAEEIYVDTAIYEQIR